MGLGSKFELDRRSSLGPKCVDRRRDLWIMLSRDCLKRNACSIYYVGGEEVRGGTDLPVVPQPVFSEKLGFA